MINITTLYDEDDNEIKLPTKWCICSTCRGNGSHSLRFGAITQSDIEQDWDPESFDDYMAGRYDERCDDCGGTGKVEVVDRDRLKPDQLLKLEAAEEEEYEYRATVEAERRMGA